MTITDLIALGACPEAIAYVQSQPDWRTAVDQCTRLDWLEWLLDAVGGPALVEYQRAKDPALAEYERVRLGLAKKIVREM